MDTSDTTLLNSTAYQQPHQSELRSDVNGVELDIWLQPKQKTAFESLATEILYGGAAYGGKSALIKRAAIFWATAIPGLQIYLLRRRYTDLIASHLEGVDGFYALLAPWSKAKLVRVLKDQIEFWNGSRIYLRHCDRKEDVDQFLSTSMDVLLIDELTEFKEDTYRLLRTRVRNSGVKIPRQYEGQFPRILCATNPPGRGKSWVKATFIDNAIPFDIRDMPPSQGGMTRQFIPALPGDNHIGMENDPKYPDRIRGLKSEAHAKAYLEGCWDGGEGQFFDRWDEKLHVVKSFKVPPHWTRYMAMDWNRAKPCSILWAAVVPDEFGMPEPTIIGGDRSQNVYQGDLPKGALVIYRELYLSEVDEKGVGCNTGLRKTAEEVAAMVNQLERGMDVRIPISKETTLTIRAWGSDPCEYNGRPKISQRRCDGYAINAGTGPSIAETMSKPPYHLHFTMADNKRAGREGYIGGWEQVNLRLAGHGGYPQLYVMQHCGNLIRTLPDMQDDPDKDEDMISEGVEDHLVDALRYICTSRPYSQPTDYTPRRDVVKGVNSTTMEINTNVIDVMQDHYIAPKRKYSPEKRIR